MRDLRLFVGFIVLLVLSEVLLIANELVGIIFYSLWLLVLIVILTTKLIEKRDLFIALTTIPLIRIVSLLIPTKGVVNYTLVVYIILFVITLMYIYNLKINSEGLYKSKNLVYLLLLLPLFGVSILEYKLINTNVMPLEYWSIALVVFFSIAYVLFFLYAIQNSLEKAFGFKGVVFTAILMTAVSIGQQNVIGIGLTFLMSLTLALMYSESRNWLLIVGLASFLNVMALIVLPSTGWF